MAVNLINSNDTTISRTDNDIKIGFSSARSTQIEDIENNIGDLSNLDTINKLNVVNAINEINSKGLKKLWENLSPSTVFPAQAINLNSDDYDYLIWFYKPYSDWDRINAEMSLKGYGTTIVFAGSGQLSDGLNWRIANFNRAITRVDDTNFNVALAIMAIPNGDNYGGNGIASGEWCIPIAIYGGKF